jgi:hypothetical protein
MNRRPALVALVTLAAGAALAVAGCGSPATAPAPAPPALTVPTNPLPAADPTTTEAPAVVIRGDATTNPACALASVDELNAIAAGPTVREEGGLTGPGSYSAHQWNCGWHFTDTELSAPAVVVIYEVTPTVRKDVIAYERTLPRQHVGTLVPGLGDVAILNANVLTVIDGRVMLTIRMMLHPTPEPAKTIAVARLVLPRVKR